MTIAWVFPGQGSQKIGMANKIIDLPNTKNRFDYASEVFGRNLFEICEQISDIKNLSDDLNNTKNTQICLFLVESVLLDSVGDRLNVPSEKILSNLSNYGNTSAATIPLMLDEAIRNKKIKENDIIATSGFGAGLSWGAALIRWG